jgi:quinolinate synthase
MDIAQKINKLKRTKNAVILAHNYQLPEVQDIADFVGDSLGLSIQAAGTDAKVIVFCGVYFMAETAKILSPAKTVLIPDRDAGCPMADMVTADDVRKLKEEHPDAKVLCYVNTTAAVKAECDLSCTSANALSMVNGALKNDDEVIFVPDMHLADYVAGQTGREFIIWKGYCPSHIKILPENIIKLKAEYKDALVLAHPECPRAVRELADKVLSTEAMCTYATGSHTKVFIIASEVGILHKLKKENPDKFFIPASERAICPNMKKITLEKVLWSLEEMTFEVKIEQETMFKARQCLRRMLEYRA